MSLNVNLFTVSDSPSSGYKVPEGTVECPNCTGSVTVLETQTLWQTCPYCKKRLQVQHWPAIHRDTSVAVAMPDQATCFFHPVKAYQACCQRCGRFVCALCDLQLGADHVCPTCFERGRASSGTDGAKAEWRHRDVLYDSIALSVGWGWILFWPTYVVALPTVIFLHAKYRKAPRQYLIPRSGWRFWFAYVGLVWLPALLLIPLLVTRLTLKR